MTSSELLDLFNTAANLAREGAHEEALQIWERITNPSQPPASAAPPVVSADFLGQSLMRKAWSLMDLGRYEEARNILASDFLQNILEQFELKVLFDYFFSYANLLGELGDIDGMDDKFARALNIAADEGDAYSAQMCWLNLMHYGEQNEDWTYLEQESKSCIQFSDNSELPRLALAAGLKRATALYKLGQVDRGIRQAKRVVTVADELGEDEAMSAAEELLKRLTTTS